MSSEFINGHRIEFRESSAEYADVTTLEDLPSSKIVQTREAGHFAICECGWISETTKWKSDVELDVLLHINLYKRLGK